MVWNFTDQSELKMKKLSDNELTDYLRKIETSILLAYGVYQIEAGGLELFESIKGDRDSIMGLPIKQIMNYIKSLK
jgi:septum formation protein